MKKLNHNKILLKNNNKDNQTHDHKNIDLKYIK